jgi:signal transduction histidine kinase
VAGLIGPYDQVVAVRGALGLDARPATIEQREHLYQIVREAVTNALKHARATEIAVVVSVTATQIDTTIEDDGIGIDPEVKSAGIGLESLSLRAGVLRGELSVGRRAGRGTVVRCRCPQRAGVD